MKAFRVLTVLLLTGCAAIMGPGVDPAKLTPREVLYAIEVGYTKAADAANQLAPTLPASAKPALLAAYTAAGAALNAADVSVLGLPPGTAATPAVSAAITAAQVAITALEQSIIASGGKI